jgi:pilus assembly protein CpaB
MVGAQPWPQHLLLDGFILADGKTNLVGMVTRAPLQQNEPVTTSKVANPNDPNFLAGELPKGMRVVTIPVNETDGVAGFVFPGDHVDVIYTHDINTWEYPPSNSSANVSGLASAAQKTSETVTETLLTNVKILAIDQRSSAAGATDAKGVLVVPKSASLMVSQADAQRVRLAQKTGTVSLALRALADKESADPLVLTKKKDISQSVDGGGADSSSDGVKIVRGAPVTEKETDASSAAIARGASALPGNVVTPGLVALP